MANSDKDEEFEVAKQLFVALMAQNGVFKLDEIEKSARFCLKAASIFFKVAEE